VEWGSPMRRDPRSDEALLAAFALGDPDAGRDFVLRFQNRVFGVAYGILGDQVLAEDVAQEAFVRAWRHGASYDACRSAVSTWLLRITHNLAVDALRLRRPDGTDPQLLATLAPATDGAAIEEAAITSDRAGAVRAALRQLPPEQARALLLAAYYDRTAAEISRLEGIPLGTAKTRIRLGMRKVRALLVQVEEVP